MTPPLWFLIITIGGFTQTLSAMPYADCQKMAGRAKMNPGVVLSCMDRPVEGWEYWHKLGHNR